MGIRDFFGERLLRPSELGGPVQRIVFTTYAALIGLALALAFQTQLSGPAVPTYVGYVFRLGIFWVGAIALTFAVIPLLGGVTHARTRWRYLIAAPLLLAVAGTLASAPGAYLPESGYRYTWMYLLALPYLAAIVLLVKYGARWATRTVLWISAALCILFFATITLATWWTGTLFGQTAFFLIVGVAALALFPALMVVGFDLSEIAAEAGERTMLVFEAAPKLWRIARFLVPVAGLGAAVLLFEIAGHTGRESFYEIALWFALLLLTAFAAYAINRPRPADADRHAGSHVLYLHVIAVAILVCFAVFVSTSYTETTPGYVTFDDPLPFSLQLPEGMTVSSRPAPVDPKHPLPPHFSMTTHGRPPTLAVTGLPHWGHIRWLLPKTVNDLTGITVLSDMPLHFGPPDGTGWARAQASTQNKRGHQIKFFVLRWDDPTFEYRVAATWYLVCGGVAKDAGRVQSMCEKVRESFSTDYIADGYRQSRTAMLIATLLLLGAAAAAFILAIRFRSRSTLLNFLAWALLLTGLRSSAGFLFGGVEDSIDDLNVIANLISALLAFIAIAALTALFWPAALARGIDLQQVRRVLDSALLGTLMMAAIFYLYVVAVGGGEHSTAIRGIIIVLVLSWELATAGGTLNPTSEHHAFPRASRVLIFAGYLVLVATCVFSFSGGTIDGRVMSGFDTETLVANGILILGGALILARTLQRLAEARLPIPATPESGPWDEQSAAPSAP